MQNLQDALEDLKETILADGFEPMLVEKIALEHGLNPIMLRRKFIEMTEQEPESYFRATDLPSGNDIRNQMNALENAKLEVANDLIRRDFKERGITKKQFVDENGTDAYDALVLKYKQHPKMEELAKNHLDAKELHNKSLEELLAKLGDL
ncbi:hypothetical protein [Sulfitobacter sabulilitoris]|uniref:Uncharacterized protein n=1 Tax=Sulfitobacter sabulilitoris TaxID=2562655 RepID=A0A5S3PD00_9RHOB|nr:hypothetical protein [Sulfitobacter sabulilitoris]TMM50737.1 hypothetical protein FDT80_15865 [Sulfitobacter sabulilitoris]